MEEEQGYPSSDKESNVNNDKATEHSSTLKSSNPAWIKLKTLGLSPELPAQDPTENVDDYPPVEPPLEATTAKTAGAEPLSAFGQWLTSMTAPAVESVQAPINAPITKDQRVEESTPPSPVAKETAPGKKAAKKDKQKKKKKKGSKKKKKATQTDEAMTLSEGIYSETLAELLVSQGHIDEAVQMYEKMCLIYPEKSRLFAAKIAELIKKA